MTATIVKAVPMSEIHKRFIYSLRMLVALNIFFLFYFFDADKPIMMLAYIFWATWLPSFGHVAAIHNEMFSLGCYSITQALLSLTILCSTASVCSFYYTTKSICEDCRDQFDTQHETCFWPPNNSTLMIDMYECSSLPTSDTVYGLSGCFAVLSCVGLLTSYQAEFIMDQKNINVIVVENAAPNIEV